MTHLDEFFRHDLPEIKSVRRVLIIGTGALGQNIIGEMQANHRLGMLPAGFIDEDSQHQGQHICGIPVLGSLQNLSNVIQSSKTDQIIIALPAATGGTIREIVSICKKVNLPVHIAHVNGKPLSKHSHVNHLRAVQLEDFLRNEPIQIDSDGLRRIVARKRVLVTGAGGSIGSELCRQIAKYDPAELVLLGHGEHSIFMLASEFARLHPRLPVARVIADVRDADRLRSTFGTFRPYIVFHAAAHKHVPLMEENVEEAITNNVLGTSSVVKVALECDVENLVLISTDKAVNPANVMGATKRVAELIVSEAAKRSGRRYVSVRFGNVLGSRGSVLDVFRGQILGGGPVTVTHPEMRRYFMTIEEAVNLVLQATLLGKGGEIFVLDMSDPIKIVDLARDLIELAGLQIGRDIEIEFTGARPGEKLFEELFLPNDHYERTEHQKIFVSRNVSHPESAEGEDFDDQIDALVKAAQMSERHLIYQYLKTIVPEYKLKDSLAATAWEQPQGVS